MSIESLLVAEIRHVVAICTGASYVVLTGGAATLARYVLTDRKRPGVRLASYGWLYGAVLMSALAIFLGFAANLYLAGYYYEAAIQKENPACATAISYFVCDTGNLVQSLFLAQMAACLIGLLLLTGWYVRSALSRS